jgi:hypothetical protein
MGHYAKVENGIVTQVIVADGPDWCEQNLGGEWVQTSYNTLGGIHSGGKFPIHKNYAGIGYTFDGVGFASPQPYPSWSLDLFSYQWQAPVTKPEDGKLYNWDEATTSWVEIIIE